MIQTAADGRTIEAFLEKPADPPGMPGQPDMSYASMGNYVFSTDVLVDALRKDAADDGSRHDMGGDIVPMLVAQGAAQVYDFLENEVPGAEPRDAGYWRDVGTLDSYFEAHMDLCAVHPVFNLYNDRVADPHARAVPAAGQVRARQRRPGRPGDQQRRQQRRGRLRRPGPQLGAVPRRPGQQLVPGRARRDPAQHQDRPARVVENAILDKNVVVPDGAVVGVDKEHDRARGFVVSAGGITVVGKGQEVEL